MIPTNTRGPGLLGLRQALFSSSSSEDVFQSPSSAIATTRSGREAQPIPVPDEPNLFYLPDDLSPIYRQIPVTTQAAVWVVSATIAGLTWFLPRYNIFIPKWKKIVWFFFQTVLCAGVSNLALQDLFYAPSRVSIQKLMKNYFLPSKFSKYQQISVKNVAPRTQTTGDDGDDEPESTELGVHFLENVIDKNNDPAQKSLFEALYVNHGFGASSLSWLPAIRPLQDALHIPIALGHDAAGFGFTERKRNRISLYTSKSSAVIGLELLGRHRRSINTNNSDSNNNDALPVKPLLLMGHSMGAIATLRMALGLGDAAKRIVLVAPALGLRNHKKFANSDSAATASRFKRCMSFSRRQLSRCLFLPRSIGDIIAAYFLRRLVATKNFWRNGLRVAWGDPDRLSDNDVLRFQWPSIGAGWENGLLTFSRAQSLSTDMTDHELLEKVLRLPNTTVSVIVGTNDRVLPAEKVRKFFKDFQSVSVVELEGLGHDPFEEDTESFVQAVRSLCLDDKRSNG